MSRSWQRFSSFGAALVHALVVAGCGMRTLDLVDERTSTTQPLPMEAAVPNVSDTDPTVVTGGGTAPVNSTVAPSSNPGVAPQPPLGDAGVMLPEDGGAPPCGLKRPYYDPITGTCLECRFDQECPVDHVCYWGGDCKEACHSDDDCGNVGLWCSFGHCIECQNTFDCDARYDGDRPFCEYGRCSPTCSSNYQCTIDEPICDDFTKDCRGCQYDRECPDEAPVCGAFGRCILPTMSEPSEP